MFRCSPDYHSTLMVQFWVFKLFSVFCCYGWQGWTWMENWKSWANVFQVLILCPQRSTKTLLWLVLPDGIWLIFNSSYNLVPGSVLGKGQKNGVSRAVDWGEWKGGGPFSLPRQPLGSLRSPIADRRFFLLLFPLTRSLLPRYSS